MEINNDILVEIPSSEWQYLLERYKKHLPDTLTAYTTVQTHIINKTKNSEDPGILCSPYGNIDYGIVGIWEMGPTSYELFLFCLDEDCSHLSEALAKTRRVPWERGALICMVMPQHEACVKEALASMQLNYFIKYTHVASASKDEAKQFQAKFDDDIRVSLVPQTLAAEVNKEWPHRYDGSEKYFKLMLERGAALGVFGAKEGDIRAWILTSMRGDLHALHTKQEWRRKGYGHLLVQTLGKQLAEQDKEVFACVVTDNKPSKAMFQTVGFKILFKVGWFIVNRPENNPSS